MTMTDWILVAAFLLGGIVLGAVTSRLVLRMLTGPGRPQPVQDSARPLANLGFWVGVTAGLLAALGVIQPSALTQMQTDFIDFLPRLLSAAVFLIIGNVASSFVQAGLAQVLARASAAVQRNVVNTTRLVIMAFAALLAITQLGVNTDLLNLAVAAILFGLAGGFALLVGLGGRSVAGEVAASRALRRLVAEGDRVSVGLGSGRVVGLHPTALELETDDGGRLLVPSSHLLSGPVTIERSGG